MISSWKRTVISVDDVVDRWTCMVNIDITTCETCGGAVKVIPKAFATAKAFDSLMGWAPITGQALASIENPAVAVAVAAVAMTLILASFTLV